VPPEKEAQATRLTQEALTRSGLADMRPAYRKLLLELKKADPATFDEATRRYREELEPSIAEGVADPVAAWLQYGIWLAGRFAAGKPMAIDPTGRARDFEPGSLPGPGDMVLFMPDDDRAAVHLLAMPAALSDPQRETAELLVP
jgi:hypothetical protein